MRLGSGFPDIGAPGFEPGTSPARIMGEIRGRHKKSLQIDGFLCQTPPLRSSVFAVDSRGLGREIDSLSDRRWSLKPVDEALVRWADDDQPAQRCDQRTDRRGALRETARVENDDPAVRPVLAAVSPVEFEEVVPVVGHDRALGRLRVLEQIKVREPPNLTTLADRFDVMIATTQLLGHNGRDHLVEQ